ncbi:hypothetical protein LTR95_010623 [Oleoguttula sp. CCFEE 5521]
MAAACSTTRRSTRGKVKLSNDIDEVISAAQRAVVEKHAAGAKNVLGYRTLGVQNTVEDDMPAMKPCRFLDLPAELRIRILSLAVTDRYEESQELTSVELPALAAVSKQFYAETLPVFFAGTVWEISVRSNMKINHDSSQRTLPRFARKSAPTVMPSARNFCDADKAYAGVSVGKILFTAQTDHWLQRLGPIMDCIRSIEINVHAYKSKADTWASNALSEISIRKEAGQAPASVMVWTAGFDKLVTQPKFELVVEQLKDKVKMAEARPDFRGFSLKDVKDTASTFNFTA